MIDSFLCLFFFPQPISLLLNHGDDAGVDSLFSSNRVVLEGQTYRELRSPNEGASILSRILLSTASWSSMLGQPVVIQFRLIQVRSEQIGGRDRKKERQKTLLGHRARCVGWGFA